MIKLIINLFIKDKSQVDIEELKKQGKLFYEDSFDTLPKKLKGVASPARSKQTSSAMAGSSRAQSFMTRAMAAACVTCSIWVSRVGLAIFKSKAAPLCIVPLMSPAPRNLRSSSANRKPSFVSHIIFIRWSAILPPWENIMQ